MPLHVQMPCTGEGGCGSCNACNLAWCRVCGCGEAGLPTDCPGARVSYDDEQRIVRGELNYTDAAGWHDPRAYAPGFVPLAARFQE